MSLDIGHQLLPILTGVFESGAAGYWNRRLRHKHRLSVGTLGRSLPLLILGLDEGRHLICAEKIAMVVLAPSITG